MAELESLTYRERESECVCVGKQEWSWDWKRKAHRAYPCSARVFLRHCFCMLQLHLSSASSPSFIILQHKVLPQRYRNSCFFQAATENGLLPSTQRHSWTQRECKIGWWMQTFFHAERADHGCHCRGRHCHHFWRQIRIHISRIGCTMSGWGTGEIGLVRSQICITTAAAHHTLLRIHIKLFKRALYVWIIRVEASVALCSTAQCIVNLPSPEPKQRENKPCQCSIRGHNAVTKRLW